MYTYNRDSKIMRKLLGKAPADTSTGDISIGNTAGVTATASPTVAYRPLKSQNAVYPAAVPISCLDVAPDRRAVVLAGPHILKTVVLDDANPSPTPNASGTTNAAGFNFAEGIDLRAAITAQPSSGTGISSRGGAMADQLNIRDVKWHGNSTIYTACANGSIFAYDLARMGTGPGSAPGAGPEPLHYIQIREDSRQVNSLDVNPHLKSWILSGSQDGMARVFDVAAPRQNKSGVLTFRQRFAPLKCIDSVIQVKWSPKIGNEMAVCTEAGVILKWDVRQSARPLLRINAHDKACTAIAWHPDGTHLISAGRDTKLHVWDMTSADKRQKPKWSISTPAPVSAIAWRPGLWSATTQSRRVAQVAVTYDDTSNKRYGTPVVHIWDLARPTMPYKEIERFDSSPSALSWQDQDMLWTVGQDGLFNQCDVAYAAKVADRHSTSAVAFSPRGDVVMFLDERPPQPRPRPSVTHLESESIPHGIYGASPRTPMLSVSKSDSEEDVVGTFLGPRRRSNRKRRPSARSANSLSSTPPSNNPQEDFKQVIGLEQAMRATGIFKSQQAMASGHVPAATTASTYQYLSSMYLEAIERELPCAEEGRPLVQRVCLIMEQFAKAAETSSHFRLAQTWRILAYAMNMLLKRRAQYHLETRVARFQKMKVDERRSSDKLRSGAPGSSFHHGEGASRHISGQSNNMEGRSLTVRSLLSEEIESTSNVPTPVARPADSIERTDFQDQPYQHGRKLSPIVEPDSFTLGPAANGPFRESPRKRHDSVPISVHSQDSGRSQISSTEGYDFYDTDVLAKAIDVPFPRKDGSAWDYAARSSNGRSKVARQDSDESFGQMFSISDGRQSAMKSPARPGSYALSRQTSDLSNTGGRSSVEYESRIRGEQIDKSPRPIPTRKGITAESPEEVFMISQTTMGSDDPYPSQTSFPSQTESEMSTRRGNTHDSPMAESVRPASPMKTPMASQLDPRPHIIEADYLPWDDDPPYPHPILSTGSKTKSPIPPLDPYTLLTRALSFESRTSPLNASAMVLLLKPLVPESVIDYFQANSILRSHHSRLMRMSLFVEATLLRNLCIQGWPAGLPDWGDNYPAIFAQAQQGVKVGFFCSSCRKPREVDPAADEYAIWTCERCRTVMSPCAICGHRELEVSASTPMEIAEALGADKDAWLPEWWFCPGCTHGGHASCLQAWHAPVAAAADPSSKFSDGCCPLDGCGHACLPGKYRGETATARAEELGRAAVESARSRDERRSSANPSRRSSPQPSVSNGGTSSSVRSDGNDVPQSRAVGMAREALNKGPGGGGILSSSPGRAGGGSERGFGERERRKSVKFART